MFCYLVDRYYDQPVRRWPTVKNSKIAAGPRGDQTEAMAIGEEFSAIGQSVGPLAEDTFAKPTRAAMK